ncbi:MAG: hypothetical protein HQK54_18305 [Oligoflexales bacterium]|nr:hypothetical protein [Oligoflexales bacterium]
MIFQYYHTTSVINTSNVQGTAFLLSKKKAAGNPAIIAENGTAISCHFCVVSNAVAKIESCVGALQGMAKAAKILSIYW